MPKYYKKKTYTKKTKYSVEQQAGVLTMPSAGTDVQVQVVPDTAIQGMRKVKHLTVSLAARDLANTENDICYWALVYVPQGTTVGTMTLTGASGMYEPNQFVMNCGVVDFSAGPCRIHCPTARNLNSGDKIVLILNGGNVSTTRYYAYVVRYAITLN